MKDMYLKRDIAKASLKNSVKLVKLLPETKWSNHVQIKLIDRTHICCKILRRDMVRGERLIKFRNSWFSEKII
jgi:hypothetical protein